MSDTPVCEVYDDDLYVSEQTRLLAAAGADAIASLEAGNPFTLLLAEDDGPLHEALDVLVETVASPLVRFAYVANPLRARLTLERLLIQLGHGGAYILDEPPAAIVRRITERHRAETCVILIIQRAETLHPEVLRFLGQAAAHFSDAVPVLQVVFIGRPEFQQLLENPDGDLDEDTVLLEQYRSPEPEPPVFASLSPPPVTAVELPSPSDPSRDDGPLAQFETMWWHSIQNRLLIVIGPLVCLAALATGIAVALSPTRDLVQPDPIPVLAEMPTPGRGDPGPAYPDPPVLRPGHPTD